MPPGEGPFQGIYQVTGRSWALYNRLGERSAPVDAAVAVVVAAAVTLPNPNPPEAAGPDEALAPPELAGVGALPNSEGALLAGAVVGMVPKRDGAPVLAGAELPPNSEAPLLAAVVAAVAPNRDPAVLAGVGVTPNREPAVPAGTGFFG